MLPALKPIHFDVFGFSLTTFDLSVSAGVVVGVAIAWLLVKRSALSVALLLQVGVGMLCAGFIGAHLFLVIAYHPEMLRENPWILIDVWNGLSSYGGMMGASVFIIAFFRNDGEIKYQWFDILVFAFTHGMVLGRLGCYFSHDHPGIPSQSFLAIAYEHGSELDMGALEMLYLLAILPILYWMRHRCFRSGKLLAITCMLYGSGRFVLDIFRIEEARYWGLTPGHYASVLLVGVGFLLWQRRNFSNVEMLCEERTLTAK